MNQNFIRTFEFLSI